MKKVIIIGGGIAGLSAGIHCLMNGFEAVIYEKNAVLGGECTGWDRQGYHIDNCIHWLTGCNPTDDLNKIWRDIGAIDDSTEFYREPYFYCLEKNEKVLHFWSDIDRARKEFLEVAPEDSAEINKLFDAVKSAESVRVPCEKSLAEMNFFEYMKFGMSMAEMGKVIKEYGKDTIADLANRFKNPLVRDMVKRYLHESYKAITLISSIGFYTSGTAAIPAGGSVGMVRRITERFKELGGEVHTNSPAVKINISGGKAEPLPLPPSMASNDSFVSETRKSFCIDIAQKAQSVSFADGSTAECDFVICAADPAMTFGKLLDKKYMDKSLRKMYGNKNGYKVSSAFNVSFGIIGAEDCGVKSGSAVYPCESYTVGKSKLDYIGIRLYDYDEKLFPKDKRVIQCNIPQENEDYEYWKNIYNDKERYSAEKQRIAETVKTRITRIFPELENRLVLLDTYSPCTFTKWCGAYKGAYMSFFEQNGYKSLTAKNTVKGLSNVFLASQWLTTNGGLPVAVTQGKFAADSIAKRG